MHELSLCEDLMSQVNALAKTHGASRVVRIVVRIGPLSGIESRLLDCAFTISRAGTVAEHAEFVTEVQAVRVKCTRCGAETAATVNQLLCGSCGSYETQLISGDELILAQVELENAD